MADVRLLLKKTDDVGDDDDLAGESGSGQGAEMFLWSSTTGSPLTTMPEMAPSVDDLVDDDANIYLYAMAASVAAFVFIVVVAIFIVFLRRQAQDKKKLQCDRNDLQAIKVQNGATSKQRTFPPDCPRQATTKQGDNPPPHHLKMAATARSHMQ
ncbi:hypothetical protein BsWGS_25825 [Bradybaena similaris]